MPTTEITHEQLIDELYQEFKPLFDSSPDGVYLWLDEEHKVCNERLAALFGRTVEEWHSADSFLDSFVAPTDRPLYSWHYHNRVAPLAFPATFRFRALHKDGSTFPAETDMIPISYKGHAVAYHFVRRIG